MWIRNLSRRSMFKKLCGLNALLWAGQILSKSVEGAESESLASGYLALHVPYRNIRARAISLYYINRSQRS